MLREDQEKQTGRSGRRWLWLLAVVPALLLVLLVVPLVRPVVLPVGGLCILARAVVAPTRPDDRQGFSGETVAVGTVYIGGSGEWHVEGNVHKMWLRIGSLYYRVAWFRGQRGR